MVDELEGLYTSVLRDIRTPRIANPISAPVTANSACSPEISPATLIESQPLVWNLSGKTTALAIRPTLQRKKGKQHKAVAVAARPMVLSSPLIDAKKPAPANSNPSVGVRYNQVPLSIELNCSIQAGAPRPMAMSPGRKILQGLVLSATCLKRYSAANKEP